MDSVPHPPPEALELSQLLTNKIRTLILAEGPISFSQFMQMALYEPGLGYYSAGSAKFGESGDFITAPEISPLFGQCFARQIQEVFEAIGNNHPAQKKTILELGAGTGRLACDILSQLDLSGSLPDSYQILEVSADLRERQQRIIQQQIPHLANRITWLDQLPSEPVHGVILANEVLDAIPVDRFQLSSGEIKEIRVNINTEGFYIETAAASSIFQTSVNERLQNVEPPDGYTSEINQQLPAWFAGLANSLAKGVILCVDYGYSCRDYYHPQRNNGTLLCHYRHRVHDDPFIHIGLQDITASVDFTAVAEAAFSSGLRLAGFTSQAYFLINCGLLEILAEHQNQITDPFSKEYLELAQQVKTLTLPGEMGERFKTIALCKHVETALMGFSTADQLMYL